MCQYIHIAVRFSWSRPIFLVSWLHFHKFLQSCNWCHFICPILRTYCSWTLPCSSDDLKHTLHFLFQLGCCWNLLCSRSCLRIGRLLFLELFRFESIRRKDCHWVCTFCLVHGVFYAEWMDFYMIEVSDIGILAVHLGLRVFLLLQFSMEKF